MTSKFFIYLRLLVYTERLFLDSVNILSIKQLTLVSFDGVFTAGRKLSKKINGLWAIRGIYCNHRL